MAVSSGEGVEARVSQCQVAACRLGAGLPPCTSLLQSALLICLESNQHYARLKNDLHHWCICSLWWCQEAVYERIQQGGPGQICKVLACNELTG